MNQVTDISIIMQIFILVYNHHVHCRFVGVPSIRRGEFFFHLFPAHSLVGIICVLLFGVIHKFNEEIRGKYLFFGGGESWRRKFQLLVKWGRGLGQDCRKQYGNGGTKREWTKNEVLEEQVMQGYYVMWNGVEVHGCVNPLSIGNFNDWKWRIQRDLFWLCLRKVCLWRWRMRLTDEIHKALEPRSSPFCPKQHVRKHLWNQNCVLLLGKQPRKILNLRSIVEKRFYSR